MVQLPGCVRCRLGACEESHLVERKPLSSAAFPCCSRLSARPESRRWALITQNVETLWSGSRTGFYFCEQGNWDRSELAFVARLKHWRGGNRRVSSWPRGSCQGLSAPIVRETGGLYVGVL